MSVGIWSLACVAVSGTRVGVRGVAIGAQGVGGVDFVGFGLEVGCSERSEGLGGGAVGDWTRHSAAFGSCAVAWAEGLEAALEPVAGAVDGEHLGVVRGA